MAAALPQLARYVPRLRCTVSDHLPRRTLTVTAPLLPGALIDTRLQPRANPLSAKRRPATARVFSVTFAASGGGVKGVAEGVAVGTGAGVCDAGGPGTGVGAELLGRVTDIVLFVTPPHFVDTPTVNVAVSPSANCVDDEPVAVTGHGGATASEHDSGWPLGPPPARVTITSAIPLWGSLPDHDRFARPASSRLSDADSVGYDGSSTVISKSLYEAPAPPQ